ncbi:MAG: thioredoxin [Patescibacteria group bacterium]|nr:thioredoxin [Patescibacteria group bacterium]
MQTSTQYGHSPVVLLGFSILAITALGCSAESHPKPPVAISTTTPLGQLEQGIVHHGDETNFDQLVLQAKGPVLVDFYADWCPPCKAFAPTLDELAREVPHAVIVKVDVDRNPNLAAQYGIQGIPSLRMFREGQLVYQQTGAASKDSLKSLLDLHAEGAM